MLYVGSFICKKIGFAKRIKNFILLDTAGVRLFFLCFFLFFFFSTFSLISALSPPCLNAHHHHRRIVKHLLRRAPTLDLVFLQALSVICKQRPLSLIPPKPTAVCLDSCATTFLISFIKILGFSDLFSGIL